jgi:hypothetical protein
MNSFFNSTIFGIILLFVGAAVIASLIPTTIKTPDSAVVYMDTGTRTFYIEQCLTDAIRREALSRITQTTYFEAQQYEMTLDEQCPIELSQRGRSLFGVFLERLHVLPPLESRWDEDGTWKY